MYTSSEAAGSTEWLAADDDEGIKKTAWGFLDALIFAGGLSVPGGEHQRGANDANEERNDEDVSLSLLAPRTF